MHTKTKETVTSTMTAMDYHAQQVDYTERYSATTCRTNHCNLGSEKSAILQKNFQENLQLETISPNNLKDRLETLVEEINKKDGEHVIALVHPKLPNSCLQISTKLKRPKKVAVTPHQKKTFCSPRLGRCPHCRKRADVSTLPENQNRFKCKHKKCGKATAIKKWLCVNCSRTRKTDIEFDSCYCYAKSLLEKGSTILTCPEKCNGWKRYEDVDLPCIRREDVQLSTKCSSCAKDSLTKDWFCTSCSTQKTEVKFQECNCYANVQDFLEAKKSTVSRRRCEKSKSHNIMLACPRKSCRKTKQFEKSELAKVIMKKVNETSDTRVMCQVCGNRNCIWKWRCYKCKKSSYKCTCKKPDS